MTVQNVPQYKVQPDGSLLFDSPINFVLKSYRKDLENPCRLVPDYKPCSKRQLEVKTLPCGKKGIRWSCELMRQSVSVSMCKSCGVPDEEQG